MPDGNAQGRPMPESSDDGEAALARLEACLLDMKKAILVLHLEVPEAVATNVRKQWNALVQSIHAVTAIASKE